jgi:hypothetical protein
MHDLDVKGRSAVLLGAPSVVDHDHGIAGVQVERREAPAHRAELGHTAREGDDYVDLRAKPLAVRDELLVAVDARRHTARLS